MSALLNQTNAAMLLTDTSALMAVLNYHMLNGTLYADSFGNTSSFHATYLTNESYSTVEGGQRVEARTSDGIVNFFGAFKQNASVVTPNLNFTGGVIHIVDAILPIPEDLGSTLTESNLTAASGAVSTAKLEQGLDDLSDVTIFVPDNDAFNAIGSILSNISTDDLSNVLNYHVVEDTVAYSSGLQNTTLTAKNGDKLTIAVIDGEVYVNAARVTVPDLLISNGVVHVINQVLNPANTTATPDTAASTAAPAFSGASTGTAGVPFTSGVATPTTTHPAATSGGTAATSSSKAGVPMQTAAVGAAALFGGAAMLLNI